MLTWGLLVLSGAVLFALYDKPIVVLKVNGNFSDFGDAVFPYITALGEAYIVAFVLLFTALFKIKYFWRVVLAFAITGVLIYLCKFHLFSWVDRPRSLINNDALLHFIEGVIVHRKHSFPSGHTTTAFLGFYILSVYAPKWLQPILALLAAGVAYSRMYLAQHFLVDVWVGSILGVLIGVTCLFMVKSEKLNVRS